MEFFIINPVITFVLFIILGFAVYMLTKLIDEIFLNKALKIKHKRMRISTVVSGIKKRVAGLAVATLVPMSIVVAFVVIGVNPTIDQNNDVLSISAGADILAIYNEFNEKLPVNTYRAFDMELDFLIGSGSEAFYALYDSNATYETSGVGSTDFSEPNNQVVGVDEMDNVLTDGKYIYTMNNDKVQITLAGVMDDDEFNASLLELYKTIKYSDETCSEDQFYPQGMFVDEDYFIVLGSQYSYNCKDYAPEGEVLQFIDYVFFGYNSSSTIIKVYDKSDDFNLEDEYTINGNFIGTRKIDDSLYIVTSNYIPFDDSELVLDDHLPTYEVNGIEVTTKYEDIIYVEGTSPNSFTTFYGINLSTTKVDMEVILGDSGYNLYVSNENMYLVGTTYYFWPTLDLIFDTAITNEAVYENKTAILKVSIGNAKVEYKTLGLVDGNTLNQFSMDEYDGYLRVTTTEGWGTEANNRLFILNPDLEVVSMLENLGKPNEQIKSTRFVGDYAYLVTFEQTDPFYVINISDPLNPFVEGELIIPGYSSYLQPLGENYILGIGYGDNHGGTNGLKIAIYDVSNKAEPLLLGEEIYDYLEYGWGTSSATYDHKDILVSIEKGIIAIPFSTYKYLVGEGNSYNSGILVFDFNFTDGLILNGYVQHDFDSDENIFVYKSKFISEYLYTVSDEYIKVSKLSKVEEILYSTNLGN